MRSHRSATETPSTVDSENPYWISFSDIMAGLLAIFILVLISFAIKLDNEVEKDRTQRKKIEKHLEQLVFVEKIRAAMLQEVKKELALSGIKVEISESNTVLRLSDDILNFERGQYELQERMMIVVESIGTVLEDALNRLERTKYIDTIFIEGYTDSTPDEREMGNWGLSTYRAITIWNYWTKTPGRHKGLLHLKNTDGKPIFSVSGYAETRRLVVPDNLSEERKKNRRIDLRFTMRGPSVEDFQYLLHQNNPRL